MEFRPCIDLRFGRVCQLVGSSLDPSTGSATVNHVSDRSSAEFARLYQSDGFDGGHVIMLSHSEEDRKAALEALAAAPNTLQVGGGIVPSSIDGWLSGGASAVILSSFLFEGDSISQNRLNQLKYIPKSRLVFDLSARKRPNDPQSSDYYVVIDRWRVFTRHRLDTQFLTYLSEYCDEFLIHAVDVEGKCQGIDEELVSLLAHCSPIPCVYAGGVRGIEDIDTIRRIGKGKIHVSIGSALDLFGGNLPYETVKQYFHSLNKTNDTQDDNNNNTNYNTSEEKTIEQTSSNQTIE